MFSLKRVKTAWLGVIFFFLALFLISSNLGRRRSWNPAEQVIIEIIAPFQKFIDQTISVTEGIWLRYFGLVNLRKENNRLKRELDALRMENYRYLESLNTSRRLQKLLQFKETTNYPVLAVQVIGRDPTGWFKSVIIDKGRRSGLKVNMAVVNAHGVVGRLVSVSQNYAKVLLIVDQNSAVDGMIQRSREKGIVKGLTEKICKFDYVVKTGDVVVGDTVITSGMGRVFPKGLPTGKVVEVTSRPGELFKDIKVRPMVDFSKLEELLVILMEDPLLTDREATD